LIEPKQLEQVYIDDAYISDYQVTKNYGYSRRNFFRRRRRLPGQIPFSAEIRGEAAFFGG